MINYFKGLLKRMGYLLLAILYIPLLLVTVLSAPFVWLFFGEGVWEKFIDKVDHMNIF